MPPHRQAVAVGCHLNLHHMEKIPQHDIEGTYRFFVSGYDFLTETLFNCKNLSNGRFFTYVCKSNFTYDSDIFNSCLSRFLKKSDPLGHFFISTNTPTKEDIVIENNFNPFILNAQIESHDIRLKLVPTFLYDEKRKWCIYLHNDLDVFIAWTDISVSHFFEIYFNMGNEDFYFEANTAAFLDTLAVRQFPKSDLTDSMLINSYMANNKYLFQSKA
jgi:hypothetical protein